MNIKDILQKRILILDGATGTELQKLGMPQSVPPEVWCIKNPSIISAVHKSYIDAGADVIYTSTFGANREKLSQYGSFNPKQVNRKLASLAKKAAGKNTLVAGDIGPIGKFIEPFGSLLFDEAVNIFKEQVKGLLLGGVDIFVIETMIDIQEARAALLAVKELSNKFTIVTMTYEKNERTLGGTDPVTALITLQSLGADAVGCNCSAGPEQMLSLIKKMKSYATVPLVVKPNAGMPRLHQGKAYFDMNPFEFSSFTRKFVSSGVNILGGCCGTTPGHIKELKNKAYKLKPSKPLHKSISAVSSSRGNVLLSRRKTFALVGECINPTGKKDLANELRQGKLSLVRKLAKDQERQGSNLLDINAGVSGVDEAAVIENIIKLLAVNTNLPLVIDSANPKVIERALRIYPGRAVINSISGEKEKLKKLLSLASKYGAMFILLPLQGKKLPKDFESRKKIIKYIFSKAKKEGFTNNDIVIDAMALAVSSFHRAAIEALKIISWVNKQLKCNTIIGLSNISFGMPKREILNATFLSLAKKKGLTMAIANPLVKKESISKKAEKFLLAKDKDAKEFLAYFSKAKKPEEKDIDKKISSDAKIYNAVIDGNREEIKELVKKALNSGISSSKLVDQIIIPAINKVGDLFDKKRYFLPQLIASAEAAKLAFGILKPFLAKKESFGKKTAVILATVRGDIHDIGKNIISLMLKNHGFLVIDLGKDVSAKRIIKEIKHHDASVVGLSALMTTTMVNMKDVVELAKKEDLNCRFMLGGAVVTKDYARSLGANYAQDGVEAVRVVKKLSK